MKLIKHRQYKERVADWIKARDLYEGKHGITCSNVDYLWPHIQEQKEGDPVSALLWSGRKRRTRYLKLPEVIVSLLTGLFFRESPVIDDDVESLLGDSKKNIDGKDTSLSTFIKEDVLENYLLYGKVIILVDSFAHSARTKTEQAVLGARPYFEILNPISVVDWEYETQDSARIGKLNFLRYEYILDLPRTDETQAQKTYVYSRALKRIDNTYTVVTYRGQELKDGETPKADQEWEVDSTSTVSGITEIPVALLDQEPWLDGVCEESLRYHNLRSARDNILHFQAFQKLFVTGISKPNPELIKAISEYTISFLPEGASVTSIEPPSLTSLEGALAEALNNVFKVGLNQLRLLPADSRVGQAADSVSEEKDDTIALVESAIEDIENTINTALKHYALFAGEQNFEGAISLNKEITKESVDQFIRMVQAFQDRMRAYPKAAKELDTKIAEKLSLSEDAMLEIQTTNPKENSPEDMRKDLVNQVINGQRR